MTKAIFSVDQNNYSDTSWCHPGTIIGIEENNNAFNPVIYPNPANGLLNIKCEDILFDHYKIILTDLLGNKCYEEEFEPANNFMQVQIDIKRLSGGM